MSLYLYELVPNEGQAEAAIKAFDEAVVAAGGELIESQVTTGGKRVFAIAEFDACRPAQLESTTLDVAEIVGPNEVRLVGADLAQIKATRPEAGYLVEWDIPDTIDMDTYLARKKANSPKYADVPEVSFLRTYVREDMDKCLCFYNAPDEAAVVRAREVVSTPIDRLHSLEG
ncbi:DUF4242 domain-containing protein [Rhodococcus sp. NPDC047139]|uniref:DUF4242 domain-containing protein n=1 Tax=Rhodococcus sp. NPDC047139 TaxID=3155141 RepID=UPI0034033C24